MTLAEKDPVVVVTSFTDNAALGSNNRLLILQKLS